MKKDSSTKLIEIALCTIMIVLILLIVLKVGNAFWEACLLLILIKNIPYKKIWGEGGLHVYVDLDDNIDTRKLLVQCYARGVLFMAGDIFRPDGKKTSSLRLGFARLSDKEVTEGLKILGEEIKKFSIKNS